MLKSKFVLFFFLLISPTFSSLLLHTPFKPQEYTILLKHPIISFHPQGLLHLYKTLTKQ